MTRTTLEYHSEKPRFVSWSHDGSLLAVCFESCVVVYETSVYALLQVLTSSECTNPQSVYFIGGSNLLVQGGTKIVLWNILAHSSESLPLERSSFLLKLDPSHVESLH